MRRHAARVAALVLLALAGSGCVSLPDHGAVREVAQGQHRVLDEGIPYLPPGPAAGEVPRDIVRGFLDAMMASPVQLSTAREYLTSAAAESWHPEREVITYASSTMSATQYPTEVSLVGAHWVDARGRWQGELPERQRTLQLPVASEDGQWRISAVPDAMLVNESWFEEHYAQVSLYFLDPSARMMVPEPVFVPRGEQMATVLVRGLTAGPPGPAPAGLVSLLAGAHIAGGAVTLDDGLATVALEGDLPAITPESRELLAAQLAWTLRQVPQISTLRVRIGSTPLTLRGGLTEFPVGTGNAYDPRSAGASDQMFGLREGHLVELVGGQPVAVAGPLGTSYSLRDVSVDLTAETAAGVDSGGHDLVVAPVGDGTSGGGSLTQPVRGAEDLAHPAWDAAGRLWLLDRRRAGGAVSVLVDDRVRQVTVPGVTGAHVLDMVVSRDGTRLVAAVRRPGGDAVVISRLDWGTGRVRASAARTVATVEPDDGPIRDLAWRSPTEVMALLARAPRLAEVRTISVDGSPALVRGAIASELVRGDVRSLVSSPAEGAIAWAITATGGALEVGPISSAKPPRGAQALTYVG